MDVFTVVFTSIGALGGLAGIVAILQFFNTRKQVQQKGIADIASVWSGLTEGAMKDASDRIKKLELKNDGLIDLVQLMIPEVSDIGRKETYQDMLDDLRRMG